MQEIPAYKLVYCGGACPRTYRVYKAHSMLGVIFQHITHWSNAVDKIQYAESLDAAVGLDEFMTNNYQQGKLGAAEQDYLKAISLDADNADAHYNLGNLYEDLQDFEKARKHYQIAVGSDVPDAYNNLARLYYIQDKKYSQARALLQNGLVKANEQNSSQEVRYSCSTVLFVYTFCDRSMQLAIGKVK